MESKYYINRFVVGSPILILVYDPYLINNSNSCNFRAITLDAANPVFYCNRAAAFSRMGEYQRAVDDCKMAIVYDSNYGKGKLVINAYYFVQ